MDPRSILEECDGAAMLAVKVVVVPTADDPFDPKTEPTPAVQSLICRRKNKNVLCPPRSIRSFGPLARPFVPCMHLKTGPRSSLFHISKSATTFDLSRSRARLFKTHETLTRPRLRSRSWGGNAGSRRKQNVEAPCPPARRPANNHAPSPSIFRFSSPAH